MSETKGQILRESLVYARTKVQDFIARQELELVGKRVIGRFHRKFDGQR